MHLPPVQEHSGCSLLAFPQQGRPTCKGFPPPAVKASLASAARLPPNPAAASRTEAASAPGSGHGPASPEESVQSEMSASAARLSSSVAAPLPSGALEGTVPKMAHRELRRRLGGVGDTTLACLLAHMLSFSSLHPQLLRFRTRSSRWY